jgi:hypothetical protein
LQRLSISAYAVNQYAHLEEGNSTHSIGGFDYSRRCGSNKNMPILMVQRGSKTDAPGIWYETEFNPVSLRTSGCLWVRKMNLEF